VIIVARKGVDGGARRGRRERRASDASRLGRLEADLFHRAFSRAMRLKYEYLSNPLDRIQTLHVVTLS
jgi:hypothetical protein